MEDRVVLLAVTKMLSGFCIAGISVSSGKWIRPVKEFGTILHGDIRYEDKSYMKPFDVVSFEFIKARPSLPHVEDWITDFVKLRPKLVGRLTGKREEFLKRYVEADTSWASSTSSTRSLGLVEPTDIRATFKMDEYSGKFDARMAINGKGKYPVTDLKWRAFGRKLVGAGGEVILEHSDLLKQTGGDSIYLSFGLSRLHEGRHWPLVVGVHTLPDYESEVDHINP